MAIQDISGIPEDKYTIKGWDEDTGDPKIFISIFAQNGEALLALGDVAEAIRVQVLAAPTILTAEVRRQTAAFSDTVIPAP